MKRKIEANIVADSVDNKGNRITSYLLTYPRFIHAELMTHRMFSRNAASSRAIPLSKMIKSVEEDPFIPIAFQNKHSGMQGSKYIEDAQGIKVATAAWLSGADAAVSCARAMDMCNITKQLCNRLLEPYLWYTVLVTATEYDNWFELRAPKYRYPERSIFKSKRDWKIFNGAMSQTTPGGYIEPGDDLGWLKMSESGAEIHIQALAEAMWDAKNESEPKQLTPGQWHIPFGNKIEEEEVNELVGEYIGGIRHVQYEDVEEVFLKVATARAARLSYMTFAGEIDYKKDIELHDTLLESRHMSPFEHVARCMDDEEYSHFVRGKCLSDAGGDEFTVVPEADNCGWCNNFRGFVPYRYIIE